MIQLQTKYMITSQNVLNENSEREFWRKQFMKKIIVIVMLAVLLLGSGLLILQKTNKNTYNETKKTKDYTDTQAVMNEQIEDTIWASDYSMNWELDEQKDSLYEEVCINIINTTDKPIGQLYFRNMATSILEFDKKNYPTKANNNKSSIIKSVSVNGESVDTIKFRKGKSVFFVDLKEELKPNEKAKVLITAQTDIPERQDRFSVQKNKYGKMYALSFCYPYLAPYRNGKWNTDPYFDDGETRANEVSNYSVTVKLPQNYLIAATGTHTTDGQITKIEGEKIRDFAIVACNYMKLDSFEVSGVKVNSYYLPGKYENRYREITKLTVEDTINILSEKIGEYPYETLDIAPCIFGLSFGGMEFPGLCMNNATAYLGKGTITAESDPLSLMEIVAHELSHQWFYAAVGSDEYNEAWLDEGFTSYCEQKLYELEDTKSLKYANTYSDPKIDLQKYCKENDEIIKELQKNKKKNYLNISVKDYTEEDMYGDREYDGSVEFLCELRAAMGDGKFFEFLKTYYKQNKFKMVTSQTVVDLIKSIDNSEKIQEILVKYIK